MTPSSVVEIRRRFGRTHCLHLIHFCPEDGGSMCFRNVGKLTALHGVTSQKTHRHSQCSENLESPCYPDRKNPAESSSCKKWRFRILSSLQRPLFTLIHPDWPTWNLGVIQLCCSWNWRLDTANTSALPITTCVQKLCFNYIFILHYRHCKWELAII